MIAILVSVIVLMLAIYAVYFKYNTGYKDALKLNLADFRMKFKNANDEKIKLEERVKELEDGIEKNFGVTVRVIKNVIDCNFNKNESLYILSGIKEQVKAGYSSIDDIEFLLALYKKTQSIINKYEDEEPND